MLLEADDFCAAVLARFHRFGFSNLFGDSRFVITARLALALLHADVACTRSEQTRIARLIAHQTPENKLHLMVKVGSDIE